MNWHRSLKAIATVAIICVIIPGAVYAERCIKKDRNHDGHIDQIAHVDVAGKLLKLELDDDHDQIMDQFQYYDQGILTRLEKDADANGEIDSRDDFKDGKRCRHEHYAPSGKIDRLILFDAGEQARRIEKDTTGDGHLDSVYLLEDDKPTLFTRDTDADGSPDIRQTYRNGIPDQREVDEDGNGRPETIIYYDETGLPVKSRHDLDRDGRTEVVRIYQQGILIEQKKDSSGSGRFDIVSRFQDGHMVSRDMDSNGDDRFDIHTRFTNDQPAVQEKDTNFDGKMDYFIRFDAAGLPEEIREDTRYTGAIDRIRTFAAGRPLRVECDDDGDGFRESVSLYNASGLYLQTRDNDQNGTPDMKIYFTNEKRRRMESDTNLDGVFDSRQFYDDHEIILRLEKDQNHDGSVDLKVFYANGNQSKILEDQNHDGKFEISQWFQKPGWTTVIELDSDLDGRPENRRCYRDQHLSLEQTDRNGDGIMDLEEHFDDRGHLTESREDDGFTGRLNLTWYYNSSGQADRAEKDSDGDGKPDLWFYYIANRIHKVEEDTNRDGKPDLWEEYDESEALVKRSKDLNFDGTPDVEQ